MLTVLHLSWNTDVAAVCSVATSRLARSRLARSLYLLHNLLQLFLCLESLFSGFLDLGRALTDLVFQMLVIVVRHSARLSEALSHQCGFNALRGVISDDRHRGFALAEALRQLGGSSFALSTLKLFEQRLQMIGLFTRFTFPERTVRGLSHALTARHIALPLVFGSAESLTLLLLLDKCIFKQLLDFVVVPGDARIAFLPTVSVY